jgi:hypothetical protein
MIPDEGIIPFVPARRKETSYLGFEKREVIVGWGWGLRASIGGPLLMLGRSMPEATCRQIAFN